MKFKLIPTLIILAALALLAMNGCSPGETDHPELQEPEAGENRIFGEMDETAASTPGQVTVEGLGIFDFNPAEVDTVRGDIFRDGYFSIFDVLIHLELQGQVELDYYFDEEMNTYVISEMDGHSFWWYEAFYDGGWSEQSVFRFDHYPYKDQMRLRIVRKTEEYLDSVYETYLDEIKRIKENNGKIIVPEVIIEGINETLVFKDVEIKAHGLREDMFQPGVVTAIDTIISLAEEGKISYDLQWYESIGTAGVVKSYWVNRINEDAGRGRCGFVYEAGDEAFYFFRGNHNHIPSDIRVINSPGYVKYFWICI